jgi:hypothetical protein
VTVCAYLGNRCVEKKRMLTGVPVMTAAPVGDDLVDILLAEFFPVVTRVTQFRSFSDEEHL